MTDAQHQPAARGGVDVHFHSRFLATPPTCAGCAGEAVTRVPVPYHGVSVVGPTMSVPVCGRCRRRFGGLGFVGVGLIALLLAVGVGLLLGARVSWSTPLLGGLVVLVSLVMAMGITATRRLRRAPVELHTVTGGPTVVYVGNRAWAEQLAEQSRGTIHRARRPLWPSLVQLTGLSLAVTPVALLFALGAHWSRFGELYVDNRFDDPVVVYVDGVPVGIFAPRVGYAPPPVIEVTRGRHDLGYGPVGGDGPAEERSTNIGTGLQLYNPGRTACYALERTTYKPADAPGVPTMLEPLERTEVVGGGVDQWFAPNPASVRADSTEMRASLRYFPRCTELLARGCEEHADRLIECLQLADGEEAAEACEALVSGCEGPR